MSFRNRLTLFFIVIVILPMLAVSFVLFRLVSDSEEGQANARLSQAQRAAQAIYADGREGAVEAGRLIGSDPGLATAIAAKDRSQITQELMRLAARASAARVQADLQGLGRFDVNPTRQVVAPAASRLVDPQRRPVGRLRVSVLPAAGYASRVKRLTSLDVVIGKVASTRPPLKQPLPRRGTVEAGKTTYQLTSFPADDFDGRPLRVHLLADQDDQSADSLFSGTSALVAIALAGFLLLAFAFALTVSRSLQSQVQRLLDAARRIGTGDFRIRVPTEGSDEFAELGSEFNAMAGQLEARLEELQQERARLQGAIRRVGESFAKGLDRDALLGIVVQTAVDGVVADCGRATVRAHAAGPPVEVARAGDLVARKDAIHAVESQALRGRVTAEATVDGATAMAQPLRSSEGDHVLGVISVARAGDRPFTDPEKELFNYLASQAAVSIENVDLHETVQRQAVTDELTGLFNHRRFQEVMALEIERTRRFGSDMGLIMLDIDNFKKVNDTYGHMQGDMVLREVAQVLRDSAREIDEPARYGGEEMAVALPQTDLDGAFQFAERVRRRIESLELPILEGEGTLRVTASFGAAALGGNGPVRDADKEALVAAADAALYRAKRSGKNRTVRAE
ncbi:MAG TPA: diguanylate cyclase [Solirubrobacteraceae bacterium]|jgi:diguanylate cyclase (GGDEF)-like protein